MSSISERWRDPLDRRTILIAIVAAAFNLRLAIAAPGPVIDTIRADTGMSSAAAGLLTAIPFVCMSVFAILGPTLIRRLSANRVLTVSLVLIAAGTLLRAVAPSAAVVLAATLPIGLGIALMAVSLPVIVKKRFPQRAGAVTGIYVASLSVGTAAVALGIVPLAELVGSWREAFAISAAPAFVAIPLWIAIHRREPSSAADVDRPPWIPDRRVLLRSPSRTEFLAGMCFGLQSLCFSGMITWVAAIYLEVGWSPNAAAFTTASIGLFTIPGALLIPGFSDGKDRRPWIAVLIVIMSTGVLGVAVIPDVLSLLWLAMFGVGSGALFALLLAIPLDLRRNPTGVATLTAWMLGMGYGISALSPILIGLLRDLTGEFTIPMMVIAGSGLLAAVFALLIPPPQRHVPAEQVRVQVGSG